MIAQAIGLDGTITGMGAAGAWTQSETTGSGRGSPTDTISRASTTTGLAAYLMQPGRLSEFTTRKTSRS